MSDAPHIAPEHITSILDDAEAAVSASDFERARELAADSLAQIAGVKHDAQAALELRARALLGSALTRLLLADEAVDAMLPALQIHGDSGVEVLKIEVLLQLGIACEQCQRVDDAFRYFESAADLASTHDLPRAEYRALDSLRLIYSRQSDMENAIRVGEAALDAASRSSIDSSYLGALNNLGVTHYGFGNNARALELLQQVVAAVDPEQNPNVGGTYINIAGVLTRMGHRDEAMTSLRKGIDICERGGVRHFAAFGRLSLGSQLIELGDYDEALETLQQTLPELIALGRHQEEADARGHI
ncbi:MAG: tetratricopeptide repeat protein, partial [bacterium]|nr:tetratricopeptide repeat protein [Candidatus Kapabacteria bacterium]